MRTQTKFSWLITQICFGYKGSSKIFNSIKKHKRENTYFFHNRKNNIIIDH